MSHVVLGLSGALGHDPSAALFVGSELVAAAEEERFIREKHAKNRMPLESARFCLECAGLRSRDVQVVAVPLAPVPLWSAARWHYARRHWHAPERALDAILDGNRRYRRYRIFELLGDLAIDSRRIEFVAVEHHLAHASSAHHLGGFSGKTAIMGIDGKGEYATTFFGYGENGRIRKIKEFYDPDSRGGLYAAMTQYLDFEMLDGEYKLMGMAAYGDPSRYSLEGLLRCDGGDPRVNTRYVNTVGLRRYREAGRGFYFSPRLVEWLGPRRSGDAADEPCVHHTASSRRGCVMSISVRATAPRNAWTPEGVSPATRVWNSSTMRRGALPACWRRTTRWRGSRTAWSPGRAHSEGAASSVARPSPASPIVSTRKSSTGSAGARSAPACSIGSRRRCCSASTPPRS
jgi:carbamoyltransferase